MKRRNFFKSFAALLGVIAVSPLELFKDESPKVVNVKWGDINIPDWVKYVSFKRVSGKRIPFIENGDGTLINVESEFEGMTEYRYVVDEYSLWDASDKNKAYHTTWKTS